MSKKIKVAFQGEKGAYSHLTCLEVFPNAEVKECSTFEKVFELARDNSDYKIIIPILFWFAISNNPLSNAR